MKIYCRNYDCEHIKLLDKPEKFKISKFYSPLIKDSNLCKGICTKEFCGFSSQNIIGSSVKYKLAVCALGTLKTCDREDCLKNKEGVCIRKDIMVDKIDIHSTEPIEKEYWICKCRSDKAISGHVDWSRFAKKKDMF